MLRAGLPLTPHETPVEALAHARYPRARGIGLSTLIGVYKYRYAMFRQVVGTELAARAEDPAQMRPGIRRIHVRVRRPGNHTARS
jgi:hypothetical protein